MRCAAWLLLFACGCGPSFEPAQGRLADVEYGLRALNRGVGVTTAFIGTAVIDPGATPEIIANAIALYFKSNTNDCGTATVTGATLDANLTKGCTLGTASMLVKGTVRAVVSSVGRTVTITFSPNLTVDGDQLLTGTLRADTSGSVSDVNYQSRLQLNGVYVNTTAQKSGVGAGAASLQTGGTLDGLNTAAGKLTVDAVAQRFTGCYPHDGTLRLQTTQDPATDETFTFDSNTPGTGQVKASDGRTRTLPPRDNCPR